MINSKWLIKPLKPKIKKAAGDEIRKLKGAGPAGKMESEVEKV